MREDPQYQTFDHLMKEFHAQQELESASRVSKRLCLFAYTAIRSKQLIFAL